MKIGIIKERKNPPDRRVVLSPTECKRVLKKFPNLSLKVESSDNRFFTDQDYIDAGASILATAAEIFAKAEMIVKGTNALAAAVGQQGPKILESIQEIDKKSSKEFIQNEIKSKTIIEKIFLFILEVNFSAAK